MTTPIFKHWSYKYFTRAQLKEKNLPSKFNYFYDWYDIDNQGTFCSCCGSVFVKNEKEKPNFHGGILLRPGKVGEEGLQKDNTTTVHVATKNGDLTLNMFYLENNLVETPVSFAEEEDDYDNGDDRGESW
jgi:hypothetical protein